MGGAREARGAHTRGRLLAAAVLYGVAIVLAVVDLIKLLEGSDLFGVLTLGALGLGAWWIYAGIVHRMFHISPGYVLRHMFTPRHRAP